MDSKVVLKILGIIGGMAVLGGGILRFSGVFDSPPDRVIKTPVSLSQYQDPVLQPLTIICLIDFTRSHDLTIQSLVACYKNSIEVLGCDKEEETDYWVSLFAVLMYPIGNFSNWHAISQFQLTEEIFPSPSEKPNWEKRRKEFLDAEYKNYNEKINNEEIKPHLAQIFKLENVNESCEIITKVPNRETRVEVIEHLKGDCGKELDEYNEEAKKYPTELENWKQTMKNMKEIVCTELKKAVGLSSGIVVQVQAQYPGIGAYTYIENTLHKMVSDILENREIIIYPPSDPTAIVQAGTKLVKGKLFIDIFSDFHEDHPQMERFQFSLTFDLLDLGNAKVKLYNLLLKRAKKGVNVRSYVFGFFEKLGTRPVDRFLDSLLQNAQTNSSSFK